MPELKTNKIISLIEICRKIDDLYYYCKTLVPKKIVHNMGYRKEKLKEFIEEEMKRL